MRAAAAGTEEGLRRRGTNALMCLVHGAQCTAMLVSVRVEVGVRVRTIWNAFWGP